MGCWSRVGERRPTRRRRQRTGTSRQGGRGAPRGRRDGGRGGRL
uniref:Uncharacterized protein n=1 Tax=Arundo donax TaxID=35708 RepID=A0A0A9LNY9_ARUDO